MPMPVSATLISTCEFTRSSSTCTLPPFGVNLIALDSRFQTTCCSRLGSPEIGPARGSSSFSSRMPLASAAGRTVSTAASMNATRLDRLHVEPHLAGDDAAHVEQVFDQLRLHAGVALDRLEALAADRRRRCVPRRSTCDQPRIALSGVRSSCDSVARNSSFMRAHALGCGARGALALEQLLALLGRLLRRLVEPRVVDRDRRLRGDADDEPLGALGEDARLADGRRTARR